MRRFPAGCASDESMPQSALIGAFLAGLLDGSAQYLGPHAAPMRDGLRSLQRAFRESSAAPDAPGSGPGEKYTGPIH